MTFSKRQSYGDSKKASGCRGLGGERDDQAEHRGFSGISVDNTMYDTVMKDEFHYTFVQTHRMYNTKGEP